jgi:hypothetical protein
MRKFLGAAAAAIVLFISCKKTDDNISNARTVQNLSGTYMLRDITWTSLGVTSDVYDTLPDCQKHNTLELNSDGSALELDARTPCSPSNIYTARGQW